MNEGRGGEKEMVREGSRMCGSHWQLQQVKWP